MSGGRMHLPDFDEPVDPARLDPAHRVHMAVAQLKYFPETLDGQEAMPAVLAGMAAAMIEMLWEFRREGFGVKETHKAWCELGANYIDQCAKKETA